MRHVIRCITEVNPVDSPPSTMVKKISQAPPRKALIATLLPAALFSHLRRGLSEVDLLECENLRELRRVIRERPVRVVVVDPTYHTHARWEPINRLLNDYPYLPVVAYLTVTPEGMREVTTLSRMGLFRVIIRNFDDSPDNLQDVIEEAVLDPFARHLIDQIQRQLTKLQPSLAQEIEHLFLNPETFATASEISRRSGISSVCVYRNLRIVKLASPKHLFIAARALRAYANLRNPGHMVQDIAAVLGYYQPRILSKHFMAVFGIHPAHSRKQLSDKGAVEQVFRFVQLESSELTAR
jgi:AraC-like DNA-binding protein